MPACSTCGARNRSGARFCDECGAALPQGPPGEQRKTVTIVFCDVVGSTALGDSSDPETVRALLGRYFEETKQIVERHGGTVEKFIGDAVMAVFGVPLVHEDDAVRATRAAWEMRAALPGLGVQARIGVNTGEVVTGTVERLATGDAVNVAARLQQAAPPGEVVVGSATVELLGGTATLEPLAPLQVKGKAAPVRAYLLLDVRGQDPQRPMSRFVGRQRELQELWDTWERVRADPHCELVTVVGDPGIGKSRLVAEMAAGLEARVVRGRCLPYGEGITYWPLVEALQQLDVLPPDGHALTAIESVLGRTTVRVSAEDIAWAFRKTLEHAATTSPLVVVFDDIQWGEQTFLDLLENLPLLSSGAAVMLLCLARPEILDLRPGWPVALRLEPLASEDVDELLPAELRSDLRRRIARTAGGNPLFVNEMVAIAGDAAGEVVVPPTLQALLAARLDLLEPTERQIIERGSVEGEIFHRGAVAALSPAGAPLTPALAGLVRRQMIRSEPPEIPGEDGFRFSHLLLRDAAYGGLPKAVRAELHQRFAAWLQDRATSLAQLDELVGFHLEQSCRYRAELGLPRDEDLAAAARSRLLRAGRRASSREDVGAKLALFQRAAALAPSGQPDIVLGSHLVDALFESGRADDALQLARSLTARARADGDQVGELCGSLITEGVLSFVDPQGSTGRMESIVDRAMPVFRAAADDFALSLGYAALGVVASVHAQHDAMCEAYELAAAHSRAAGHPNDFLGWRCAARLHGTASFTDLLAWLDEEEHQSGPSAAVRMYRPLALAHLGRLDEARSMLADLRAELAERGSGFTQAIVELNAFDLELTAGDSAAGIAAGEQSCRRFEELGERSILSTTAAMLARALWSVGRVDEADSWARRAAQLGASDDLLTEMCWRQAEALVAATRGDHAEAARLAREAIAVGERSDDLLAQAGAYLDLAEVLLMAHAVDDAADALDEALTRYERKGSVVLARRTRERLATLR